MKLSIMRRRHISASTVVIIILRMATWRDMDGSIWRRCHISANYLQNSLHSFLSFCVLPLHLESSQQVNNTRHCDSHSSSVRKFLPSPPLPSMSLNTFFTMSPCNMTLEALKMMLNHLSLVHLHIFVTWW